MDLSILLLFMIVVITMTWLFISLILYFTPIIVAYIRKHNNILAISLLNVVLGWTFAGWLAALLWSLNSDTKQEED